MWDLPPDAPAMTQPPQFTAVQLADFACVPVKGAPGFGIALGEFLNGARGWTGYRHVLGYDGWWDATPPGTAYATVMPDSSHNFGPGHYVFEAHPDGARRRKLDGRPEDIPGALWSTGLTSLTRPQAYVIHHNWVPLYVGNGYSPADYLALAAHRLRLHPLDYALRGYVKSTGHNQCAQLWDLLYRCVGCHLFADGRWEGDVTPWDMASLLLARGAKVTAPGRAPA